VSAIGTASTARELRVQNARSAEIFDSQRRVEAIGVSHGVDCGVDSPRFPAALALKPAGQITRIVYVIRDFAGLECDTLSV
jgi:hypothetical protein